MDISVMIFPFYPMLSSGEKSVEEFLGDLHDAGVTGLETMLCWETSDPKNWRKLTDLAKEMGMRQTAFDIGLNLVAPTPELRREVLDAAKRHIAFCREQLDCDIAMIYNSKPLEGMELEDAFKVYADVLSEVADIAAPYGITACIEDFDPVPDFVCSADSCLKVLSRAPKAGLAFDTGNFLVADDDPVEVFPRLKHLIRHVHVKEKRLLPAGSNGQKSLGGKLYENAEFGKGSARIAECVELLKGIGYDGALSIEAFGGFAEVLADARYLANCLK